MTMYSLGELFLLTILVNFIYTSQGKDFKREFFADLDQFFDPKYDFDFTNMPSEPPCTRGGESYRRPKGWYRMALKVKDKYPDGNTWLGTNGWRDYSAPGEWPVAYHGTSLDGAKDIIQSHYKAGSRQQYGRGVYYTPLDWKDYSAPGEWPVAYHGTSLDGAKGIIQFVLQQYGRGVYSTPLLDSAISYTKEFTSKKNGKRYRVILENGINPLKREQCKSLDYWLIPIAEHLSSQQERERLWKVPFDPTAS